MVGTMGWFSFYRSWLTVAWPSDAIYGDEAVQLDWRVRLGITVTSLAITGLLVALTVWVAG